MRVDERAWWDGDAKVMHGISFPVIASWLATWFSETTGAIEFSGGVTDCGVTAGRGATEALAYGLPVEIDCARCQVIRVARRAANRIEAGS